MRDAVGLAKASSKGRQADAPRLEEDHEEAAAAGEVGLSKLEDFTLLLAKRKRDKGSLVAVTNVQTGEEPLDMVEREGQGRTPYLDSSNKCSGSGTPHGSSNNSR